MATESAAINQAATQGDGEPAAGVETVGRSKLSLRELEVLHAVVQTGKTTAAAARLGISQPAVSRALRHLEARLGRALFNRNGGRLVPTAEALVFNQRIEPIFETLAGLENEPWKADPIRPLRIAAPPTLAHRYLHRVIGDFAGLNPDQRIQLEIGTATDVVHSVADGKADLGVCDEPPRHVGLLIEPLRRADAHVVLPAGHALVQKAHLEPRDFDGCRFVALTRRFPTRVKLDRLFAEQGVRPEVSIETSTSASVCELVREGVGIGVLNPFPIALNHDESLVFRPFLPRISYFTCFVLPASPLPLPAARKFVEFARDCRIDDIYSRPA